MATSESDEKHPPSEDKPQDDVEEEDVDRMMAILYDQEEEENIPLIQENDDGNILRENENDDEIQTDHGQPGTRSYFKLSYMRISFLVAIGHILYALRTREQMYLAFLYMTNSKLSYIIIGNGIVALLISVFQIIVRKFLNGLRLMESEAIVDHCRWNVTETCIALTMFRQDLSSSVIFLFLFLVMIKCVHWAVELRVDHLRMTQDAFYLTDSDDELNDISPSSAKQRNPMHREMRWSFFVHMVLNFSPKLPRVRGNHLKLISLMMLLYMVDMVTMTFCVSRLLKNGPNVIIIFLFEAALLVVSIMSSSALYGIHFFDGFINVVQKLVNDKVRNNQDDNDEDGTVESSVNQMPIKQNYTQLAVQKASTFWRDQRITTTFFVELMALAAKFLFHLSLFGAIFALYGLPINIVRDFYMAFIKLKNRLIAFASYRDLTRNMNTRFKSVSTEKELEEAGKTCIICRDQMEVDGIHGDCKQLPICNHVFHKHCLREWLVQQQTCPTCRADIQKNEARAKVLRLERSQEHSTAEESEAEKIDSDSEVILNEEQGILNLRNIDNKERIRESDSIKRLKPIIENRDPNAEHLSLCRVASEQTEVPIFDDQFNQIRSVARNTVILCSLEQTLRRSDETYTKTLDGWIDQGKIEVYTKLSG